MEKYACLPAAVFFSSLHCLFFGLLPFLFFGGLFLTLLLQQIPFARRAFFFSLVVPDALVTADWTVLQFPGDGMVVGVIPYFAQSRREIVQNGHSCICMYVG